MPGPVGFVSYAISRSIPISTARCCCPQDRHQRPQSTKGLRRIILDRGSQYASEDYHALLREHGLKGSMGRRGNPYDNAKAESCHE